MKRWSSTRRTRAPIPVALMMVPPNSVSQFFGRRPQAQREFRRALELAPGRARSLFGLGRAALAAGDRTAARKALEELKRIWHSADASLPDLAELNRLLAQLK
jgi:tetratricopeptide (TPR) repeat protein